MLVWLQPGGQRREDAGERPGKVAGKVAGRGAGKETGARRGGGGGKWGLDSYLCRLHLYYNYITTILQLYYNLYYNLYYICIS